MGKKFIHSTCGQNMVFTVTAEPVQKKTPEIAKVIKKILVKGGAWVLNSATQNVPRVVITEIDDEDLAILLNDPLFNEIKANGYYTIHDVGYMEEDSRGLPMDMQKKDGTSQIVDSDHANGTDERVGHDQTRATFGENNQFGGKQPVSVETSDYGPIRLS